MQIRAIEFPHARDDFELGKIQHIRHRHPGLQRIALADIGKLHAWKKETLPAVLANRHQAGHGREQLRLRNAHFLALHVDHALIALLAQHGELRQCLLVAGFDVAFELLQPSLGLFEVQQVFLGINRSQQLVALHFQFRAADAIAGFEQTHLILAVADREVGLGFLDLLVDLVDLELRFLETRAALGVVEFDDQVFVARQRTQRRDLGDLHGAKEIGCGKGSRAHCAQFAARIGADNDITTQHLGGGHLLLALRQLFHYHVGAPGRPQHEQQDQKSKQKLLHESCRP